MIAAVVVRRLVPALVIGGALLVVPGALLLVPVPAAGQDASVPLGAEVASSSRELAELRQTIAAVRDELADLETRRHDADEALNRITREMGLVKELLAGLDQREVLLARQRDTLEVRLDHQRETYDLRRQTLARRLRALHMQGPQRDLEQILSSQSFSTLVARLKFGAMLARIDGNLVEQTRQQARQIELEQQQLQAALAGIWEAREEARGENDRLTMLEAERRGLLRELQEEQDRTAGELARLRRQEQQLRDLIAQMEERRRAAEATQDPLETTDLVPFADRRGDLPWPAAGSVVREFGNNVHPRFGTVTVHNGLSIATAPGAPVYAVAPGTVQFADHLPGFGRCVILDHGAGHYTLYANLDRFFVSRGAQISGGQILAELGAGDEDGHPELYFEIREGRDARDPRSWLKPPR
jgi:septal ring factor EnvC (AmiA/AmiB activator)